MKEMSIQNYKKKMQKIGYQDGYIDHLIELYQSCQKADSGKIMVLEGDFLKKNVDKYA